MAPMRQEETPFGRGSGLRAIAECRRRRSAAPADLELGLDGGGEPTEGVGIETL